MEDVEATAIISKRWISAWPIVVGQERMSSKCHDWQVFIIRTWTHIHMHCKAWPKATLDPLGSLKPRKSHCNLPLSKGNCQAKLRRFYFDYKEGICKLFIFGGCTGTLEHSSSSLFKSYSKSISKISSNWVTLISICYDTKIHFNNLVKLSNVNFILFWYQNLFRKSRQNE